MLGISIFITSLLLFQLMEKVKSNPIVTYTSDVAMKITEIYFPAFIYCVPLKPARDMISFEYAVELANLERNLTSKEWVVHVQSYTVFLWFFSRYIDLMTFNMWALASSNGFDYAKASVPITRKEIWFARNAERPTFVQANYMVRIFLGFLYQTRIASFIHFFSLRLCTKLIFTILT